MEMSARRLWMLVFLVSAWKPSAYTVHGGLLSQPYNATEYLTLPNTINPPSYDEELNKDADRDKSTDNSTTPDPIILTPNTFISATLGDISVSLCPASSCKDQCSLKKTSERDSERECRCDELCVVAGDCCLDYFAQCRNVSDVDTIANFIDDEMTAAETPGSPEKPNAAYFVKNYGECVHIGINDYTLVTSCPKNYSDVTVKNRCEDVNMTSLASHVQEPSIVFKNSHCAECHNTEAASTVEWQRPRLECTGVTIKTPQDVIEAFQNRSCKMKHYPPTNKAPRSCSSLQSQKENPKRGNFTEEESLELACSKTDELLCKVYKFPRHYSAANTTLESVYEECLSISKTYDNPHCAKCCTGCTFPELTDTTCSLSHRVTTPGASTDFLGPGIVTMFDLSEDGLGVMVDGQLITWPGFNCAEDEVYDHLEKVCRKLTCPPGYELLERQCVPVDSLVPGSSQLLPNGTRLMLVEFRLAPNESCNRYLYGDVWRTLQGRRLSFGATEMTHSCSNDDLTLRMLFDLPSDGDFTLMYKAFWDAFEQILVKEKIFVSIMLSNHDHDTTVHDVSSVCPDENLPLVLDEANMTRKDGIVFVVFRKNGIQQLYPLENVYFSFLLSHGKSEVSEVLKEEGIHEPERINKTGNVILAVSMDAHNSVRRQGVPLHPEPIHTVLRAELCEQDVGNSSLLCATLEYPKNQTQEENGTLVILESGMVFALDEYKVHDDRVFVCSRFKNLNDFWSELKFFDFSHEQFYLMLILTALSVLLLAFVLVVYFLLPELRTLPGRVTICHVACLLVGHLTLMVEVPCKACCHFVAILSHFVWLAAFAWVSCLAVHMALTFFTAAVSQKSRYEADRVFRKYSLVCWGLPLAVVATCAVLDFTSSISFEVGYGEKVCGWIGESKATVWFFFVPLSISLLVNLLAFFAAVFGIERTTRASSMASSRRSEGKRLLVYVKMSAALGFTWVLGLGVAFGQWVWLVWIFAVLNSLQGAFIAMAFLVNERVLRMLKKKLRGKAQMGEKGHSGSADQTQSVSVFTTATSVSDARI